MNIHTNRYAPEFKVQLHFYASASLNVNDQSESRDVVSAGPTRQDGGVLTSRAEPEENGTYPRRKRNGTDPFRNPVVL